MENDAISSPPQAADGSSKAVKLISKVTWYEFLAIPIIAVAATIFFVKDALMQAFLAAQERTTLMLGVGTAPIVVWACLFIATLVFKSRLLRSYKLWLASIPLLALTLGILALFRPIDGSLAWFTLGGYVSLGGIVGEAIAGPPVLWQQMLRLGALAIITIVILSPVFAALFAAAVGRIIMYAYVGLALTAKSIGSMFQRRKAEQEEIQDTFIEDTYADNDNPAAYTTSRQRSEPDYAAGYSHRQVSRFPSSATPFTIESTMERAAFGRVPHTSPMVGAPVTELLEQEESDMQANTDYDFGYSHAIDGAIASIDSANLNAVQEMDTEREYNRFDNVESPDEGNETVEDYDIALAYDGEDEADTSPASTNGAENELHVIDTVDRTRQLAQQEEDSKLSGLKIRLLGKPRKQWAKPSVDMLEQVQDRGVPEEQIRETAGTIKQTLADHGIEIEIGSVKYGPTVTMYGIIPGWIRRFKQVKLEDEFGNPIKDQNGKQIVKRQEQKTRVKVGNILSCEKDLSLALRTPNLRIETPVMGKAQLGIEIPNQDASPVTLRSVMESPKYKKIRSNADLPVALGKGTGGEDIALDLAKMPHLLIAGATGSGKSVALNAIIAGLLMEKSPSELRMLLIDPKRVELTPYNGIPHLLCPVIVEVDEVVSMLKGVINEMMNRYRKMEEVGVRNIEAYNKRMRDDQMPFLLVVVDELADLMMTAAFDVEQSICRLAQLGRATGIHLILATQRPSVDVVTGLIKANFPSRVSFGVTSHTDSRTILDTNGAEKLLGKGDMLYLPRDAARPTRAQGVFISDKEIDSLINFWKMTPRAWLQDVNLSPISDEESESSTSEVSKSRDALFDKAVELAHTQKKLSTSLLQRRLRIGYPRAARLMDELEENGVVSASDGSKSRDVIINNTG